MHLVSKLALYNVLPFLSHFHEKGFKIIVLRGYEGLPDHYGGDLDIEIPAVQYKSFVEELLSFAKRDGLRLFKYVYRPHVTSFKFYRIKNEVLEKFILDISYRGGMWYGFSYLSNEELFSQARSMGKWLVPDTLHELILKIFINMLIGGSPPNKYFVEIKNQLPLIQDRFFKFVQERFPGVDANELYYSLVNGDVHNLRLLIPKLKLALIIRNFQNTPLRSLGLAIYTILSEIYYYFQMNGLKFELSCDYATIENFECLVEDLRKNIGHVCKKMIFIKANEVTRSPLSHFSWAFDLFRDRLILWYDCIGNKCQEKSEETYVKGEPACIVLKLYKELEKRNSIRYRNMFYRVFLWRFSYNHVYGKLLRQIQHEVV